jgi:hypothetical protein
MASFTKPVHPHIAAHQGKLSSGDDRDDDAGGFSGGAPADLWAMKRCFPDRWSDFLRAHFRDSVHVAFTFGVSERAARDWLNGVSGPRGSHVALAFDREPVSAQRILLGRAA